MLKELAFVQPREKVAWGHLLTDFQCLTVCYSEDGGAPFKSCDRTRKKEQDLLWGRFHLDIRKKFITMRAIKHWKRSP